MGVFLNLFRVLIVSLLTASCSAVVCIDSYIEREPVPVKDEWVFERKIKNENPNWSLIETKSL